MKRNFLTATIAFSFLLQVSASNAATSNENFDVTPNKPAVAVPNNETTVAPTRERISPIQSERLNRKKDSQVNEGNPPKVLSGPLTPFSPLYIDP
jgi:hypothetical protein